MALSGSFTSSWQQRVLDALANNNVVDAALDGLKVGLFTADPGEAGSTSNEISGNGYARQALTFGDATNNASNHAEVASTNALAFAASGGAWSGITHAGVFRTKSYVRSIRGTTNNSTPTLAGSQINLPSSYHPLSATLTVTSSAVSSSSDSHVLLTVGSNTASTYNGTDLNGNPNFFARIKSGPLAGNCYEIVDDGTNTLTLDVNYEFAAEEINGQKIEVREKVSVQDVFGAVPASGGSTYTPAGLLCGSTSTADRLYLVYPDSGQTEGQAIAIIYAQQSPSFSGGDGYRQLGISASTDVSSLKVPPAELITLYDQTSDDYCILVTNQSADWTLTSQVSTTDEMVARFQFEDGSGNAQTHNVADGDQLNITAGDLKLSLN